MSDPNEMPARAHIMQLTTGFVLLIDGKTHAYPSVKALQTGVGKEIAKRPPKTAALTATPSYPAMPTGAGTTEAKTSSEPGAASPQDSESLQIQIFNFGRTLSEVEYLTLQDFERAGQQYFPAVWELPWAQPIIRETAIKLANKAEQPTTVHVHTPAEAPLTQKELGERLRRDARKKAERHMADATVNTPGNPWYHDDCGRVSDCIVNTETGIEVTTDSGQPCARCQQCLDDTCPFKTEEQPVAGSSEETLEPRDIEPDEDGFDEQPAIILNEKRQVIGKIMPGEQTTYATV
jgi:hypothetical protein